MSRDPKKFLHVLAVANEKMDLHVKVHHNQKHQIYRQVNVVVPSENQLHCGDLQLNQSY